MFEKSISKIKVDKGKGLVYKYQPKTSCDREFSALYKLRNTGFVPRAERLSQELIVMEYIEDEEIKDKSLFERKVLSFANHLSNIDLKHGDLTRKNILVKNSSPVFIDWSDCIWTHDYLPTKRVIGDRYYLDRLLKEAGCDGLENSPPGFYNTRAHEMIGFIQSAFAHYFSEWNVNRILDLGCGHGDIIDYFSEYASQVIGVDRQVFLSTRSGFRFDNVTLENKDIVDFLINHDYSEYRGTYYSMIFLTSVLPYIPEINRYGVLEWMRAHAHFSIIEIQNKGDGPGFLENQDEVKKYLQSVFSEVVCIGSTLVKDGMYERRLFACR